MDNWRWAGVSECEKTGICMCEIVKDPPFMSPCFRDKTCLIPASEWRGDDGCYELKDD